MKRDMHLIRQILFALEHRPEHKASLDLHIDGCDRILIRYQLLLLAQAGLVDFEPEVVDSGRIARVHVFGLTWSGHEFLDAIRPEEIWAEISDCVEEAGALPFELIQAQGMRLLKRAARKSRQIDRRPLT
ncbi:DUF2513 domain-containing protein [Variovorax sp. ZT5P49]|uniref:DUF2513 domain-containing protein n=1 Tax=Variovorax sp. ZT5P49 TaxID=3443733 RepID=UPI003F4785AB